MAKENYGGVGNLSADINSGDDSVYFGATQTFHCLFIHEDSTRELSLNTHSANI